MTRRCCICGAEFEPKRKDQVTCLDEDCKHIQHLEYLRQYAANRRKEKRSEVNEYNRLWMRGYRDEQKAIRKARLQAINSFEGLNYAERQKTKTLAIAGKVQI